MSEMEKIHYVATFKPAYLELLRAQSEEEGEQMVAQKLIVAITQGGFGQDVIDDERQVKERFLEYLFYSSAIDLPRSAETFDLYFELERMDELIDLDEDLF
jgi:hypothetical protein